MMEAISALREIPGVYGVELRSGKLRLQARDPELLLKSWAQHLPYPHFCWKGYDWVEPDREDVFMAYSRGTHR